MRTTVALPDHLWIEAKRLAAERRIPWTRILEESLRAYLAEERTRAPESDSTSPLPVIRNVRPVRGIDLDDTSALLDVE
jgi:hypothetical protein